MPANKTLQIKIRRCFENYKDAENFLHVFSPANTEKYIRLGTPDKMIMSQTAPTLTVIRYAYGIKTEAAFLNALLLDTARFFGNVDNASSAQLDSVADMISTYHFDLKATEIMLFFSMFKAGKFRSRNGDNRGKMYGGFSGETIADCLFKFREYRAGVIDKLEQEKRQKEKEAQDYFVLHYCPTPKMYKELHWLFNMGYEPRHIAMAKAEREKEERENGTQEKSYK